jgi:hypothetical protein
VSLREMARAVWAPAYTLGAALAAVLVGLRLALDPHHLPVVAALVLGGPLAYWAAYAAWVLESDERALVRSLLRR